MSFPQIVSSKWIERINVSTRIGSVYMYFETELELPTDIVFWAYQAGPFKLEGFRRILLRSILQY
jgi:hypothetical protein